MKSSQSPSIEQILNTLEHGQERDASKTLPYWVGKQKLHRYVWVRLQLPILSSLVISTIHYFFWVQISDRFPLFGWGDFFADLQLIFVFSLLTSAGIESIRVKSRASSRTTSMGSWLLLFSFLPLVWILGQILGDISHDGRYFGIYDLARIFLWSRVPLSTQNRILLAEQASDRRVRLWWFHWLLPPLVALATVGGYFYFAEPNPWVFPLALGLEVSLTYILQKTRIEKRRFWNHFAKPKWADLTELLPALVYRLFLSFPILIYHVAMFRFILNPDFSSQSVALIHSIQPVAQIFFKSPGFFWKERIDYENNRGLRSRFALAFLVLGGIWFITWALLSPSLGIAALGLLIVLQWMLLGRWLGITPLAKEREQDGGQETWIDLRRQFWNRTRRSMALSELRFPFRISGRYLVFPSLSEEETQALRVWGRGWIQSIGTAPQKHERLESGFEYSLKKLKWVNGRPGGLHEFSNEEFAQFYRILLRTEGGAGKGRFRVGDRRFLWVRDQSRVWLRVTGQKDSQAPEILDDECRQKSR